MSAEATLGDLAREWAALRGERPALQWHDRITSYAALDRQADAIAAALVRDGLRPGQRISYLGKNSDRYFALLFGAARSGAVMVPIGWRLAEPEVAFLLADSAATHLFVEPAFASVGRKLAPQGTAVICTEDDFGGLPGLERWQGLRNGPAEIPAFPSVDPAAPVLQLYTSGTTGRPKGAMLAHQRIFPLRPLCAAAGLVWDNWQADEVSLLTMPVAHIAGSGWGLVGLYNGARTIVMPEFDAAEIIARLSSENIGRVFLVPTAIQLLLRHPTVRTADFGRLRYILYGASPMPLPVLREALEVFGCGFIQNYGMTETCGTVAVLPPEDHDPAGNERMLSAGRALPGVQLRVVDGALRDLPPGAIGQVLISSPTNMVGYWNREEATRETCVDGWILTGDAGYLDAGGYLFICDRLKDVIISGGENVYPAEIEGVLHGHPAIADVAVIGIPDPTWGEAVCAIVVPEHDGLLPEEIVAWTKERLAAFKAPKSVVFMAELPRNANGKVLRRELRAPYWEGMARAVN